MEYKLISDFSYPFSLLLTYFIYYLHNIFNKVSFLLYIYTLQAYDYLLLIILLLTNITHMFLTSHTLSINAYQIYFNLKNFHLLYHKTHIAYYFLLLLAKNFIIIFKEFSIDFNCFKNLLYQNFIILFPFKAL